MKSASLYLDAKEEGETALLLFETAGPSGVPGGRR